MVRRSAAPPPTPPKVNGPDIGWGPPSPVVWGVGPSSPCGVGFWGLRLKGIYKASSRQGLREDLQCMFFFGLRACI